MSRTSVEAMHALQVAGKEWNTHVPGFGASGRCHLGEGSRHCEFTWLVMVRLRSCEGFHLTVAGMLTLLAVGCR